MALFACFQGCIGGYYLWSNPFEGCFNIESMIDPKESEVKHDDNKLNQVNCPVKGKIVPLNEVNDEMFSKEVLGKGVAIIPVEGKIYAPANGIISATFETKHAIGLTTENGSEILIHVGIDTVKLEGKPFIQYVEKGEYVKAGSLLLEFDLKMIKEAGLDYTTMVVVTNSNDYLEVIPTKLKKVTKTDRSSFNYYLRM